MAGPKRQRKPQTHKTICRRLRWVSVLIFVVGCLNLGHAVFRFQELTGGTSAGLGRSLTLGWAAFSAQMIQTALFLGLGFHGITDPMAPMRRVLNMSIGIRVSLVTLIVQSVLGAYGIGIGENASVRLVKMLIQILLPMVYRALKKKECVCRRRSLGV